jgi:hypothetical protein
LLSAAMLVVASACANDNADTNPYAARTAKVGESPAVLGRNMSLANLRFDGDSVLFDIDASPAQADGPHAKPEDIRFGLHGALAHPLEANVIGGCRDVTSLAVQPAAAPTPDKLSGTVRIGPMRDQSQVRGAYVYSPADRMPGTTVAYGAAYPSGLLQPNQDSRSDGHDDKRRCVPCRRGAAGPDRAR